MWFILFSNSNYLTSIEVLFVTKINNLSPTNKNESFEWQIRTQGFFLIPLTLCMQYKPLVSGLLNQKAGQQPNVGTEIVHQCVISNLNKRKVFSVVFIVANCLFGCESLLVWPCIVKKSLFRWIKKNIHTTTLIFVEQIALAFSVES